MMSTGQPSRTTGWTTTLLGAVVSLGLMAYTGRNNPSLLLMLLFTGWVASPFIGLFLVHLFSKSRPVFNRVPLNKLMVLISIGSMWPYIVSTMAEGKHPAFIFLVVPFISWIVIVVVIFIAKSKGKD